MSTAYIYSNYGYDDRDGERGHWEFYAGLPWWLPYQKVTAIPNFALRELDHDASTPSTGQHGVLTYMTVMVAGERIAEELCAKQKPFSNHDVGIIRIEGRPTGQNVKVLAGWDTEGHRVEIEVPEREPLKKEIALAEELTERYKRERIAEYFQSKRERMTGGKGLLNAPALIRTFMDELGVEDIDDVDAHRKAGGLDLDLIKVLLESKQASQDDINQMIENAVEKVRKAGKAQVAPTKLSGNRYEKPSLGLAEHKARYDAAQAAKAAEPVETVKE